MSRLFTLQFDISFTNSPGEARRDQISCTGKHIHNTSRSRSYEVSHSSGLFRSELPSETMKLFRHFGVIPWMGDRLIGRHIPTQGSNGWILDKIYITGVYLSCLFWRNTLFETADSTNNSQRSLHIEKEFKLSKILSKDSVLCSITLRKINNISIILRET
jgi:hypothetical protein